MNDFQQKVTELKVHGFTIIENVLDESEIEAIKNVLISWEEKVGNVSTHRGTASHVSNLIPRDPIFFKCIDHEKVLPLLENIMGKDLILGSLNSRIVRHGDGNQGLHGDIPKQLLRQNDSPVMMNTVWPLCDYTEDNGATRVVPGSHLSGLAEPPENFEVKYEVKALCKAGSVIIFNGQLWHGGGENKTQEDRHALFGHYRVAPWMRFQCDPHNDFPEANYSLLNDRQKALLRMKNGVPAPHGADMYGN